MNDVHRRWIAKVGLHRSPGSPDYQESWYWQQCGGCAFYIPLNDPLGADWGACSGASSQFDGLLRFEHDGCEAFEQDSTGRAPFSRSSPQRDGSSRLRG
ncbi:MAG: DUF3027 domain-containing protein [Sporichthyaceae bacterium]|jgi:hypothetical protein